MNFLVISAVNCVPLSDSMTSGRPVLEKISDKALDISTAVIFTSGIASGHLVHVSIKVNMNLCFLADSTGNMIMSTDTF